MPNSLTSATRSLQLRADAEGRLQNGSAPLTAGWTISPEALSLLYRLSSDPKSSADALKLLHELQTHQVELDLQHAQLAENEHELALQLAHYQALYEKAPAAYLVIGRDGRILQSNEAANRLFGLDGDQVKDHLLTSLLSAESKPALKEMLEESGQVDVNQAVPVKTLDSRPFRLVSDVAPQDDAFLVLIFPESPTPGS